MRFPIIRLETSLSRMAPSLSGNCAAVRTDVNRYRNGPGKWEWDLAL